MIESVTHRQAHPQGFANFYNLDKPLIAVVPGYGLGGGLEFALSCDIRIR
ncbi:MAG: enoyl-CoA hydratase-related protein [Thermodesulfobacteriota bacterium]